MFAPLQPEDALLNHLPFFGSRETSLIGTADFAYWRDRLAGPAAQPGAAVVRGGKAKTDTIQEHLS
jgi:hypothetical protein